jgi:hypothetical protein
VGVNQYTDEDDFKIKGNDGVHHADVFLEDGIRKLQTNATATVESLLGETVFPYTYLTIDNIGGNGDTIRVQIPDDSVDVTVTKTASETSDNDLAKKLRDALNADSNFDALYTAKTPRDSHLVCIESNLIQTIRPDSGDVILTTTGTLVATLGFDNIKDRPIALAIFPHPSDCRKGTINVTGEIGVLETGRPPKRLLLEDSSNSFDMDVNGSGTPVLFTLANNADYDPTRDFVVTELRIECVDGAIKLGNNKFMGMNSLSNGFLIQVRSDGNLEYDENIILTEDIHHAFVFGEGSKFDFIPGPADDSLVAVFARPFFVRKTGTFPTDDGITITVRDNLSSISRLRMSAVGFFED